MSVIHLDFRHYEAVYVKACSYIWRTTVDINYCGVFSGSSQNEIREWLKELYRMNVYSLHCEHDEKLEQCIQHAMSLMDSWNYVAMDVPVCNTYQMLKALECIDYQIEKDTIQRKDFEWNGPAVKKLRQAMDRIRHRIIETIPEYRDAKWCIE